jgi:hypothetical protein
VIDRDGGAVACAFTPHEPWGIARLPQGSAFLMAPAPREGGADSRWLSVAIALRDRSDVTFAGGASGGGVLGAVRSRKPRSTRSKDARRWRARSTRRAWKCAPTARSAWTASG